MTKTYWRKKITLLVSRCNKWNVVDAERIFNFWADKAEKAGCYEASDVIHQLRTRHATRYNILVESLKDGRIKLTWEGCR